MSLREQSPVHLLAQNQNHIRLCLLCIIPQIKNDGLYIVSVQAVYFSHYHLVVSLQSIVSYCYGPTDGGVKLCTKMVQHFVLLALFS